MFSACFCYRNLLKSFAHRSLANTTDTIDLTVPWTNANSSIWGHIPKNTSTSGLNPPCLNDGSIFSNNSSLYLYGGATSKAPGASEVPPPNGVWQYDIQKARWSNIATHGDQVQRIHLGMTVQSTSGTAYYLGGVKTPNSDAAFAALPGAMPYMVQGLLSFNESSPSFRNESTVSANDHGTVAGGNMVLIESLGRQGVLVTFGGFTNIPGLAMTLQDHDMVDSFFHLDLTSISVYDIATATWYRQNATGDVPPWR